MRVSRAKAWRTVPGTRRAITDAYVPVGARSFRVESTRSLAVGDRIIVHRPSTSRWIGAIGMDRIPPRPVRVTPAMASRQLRPALRPRHHAHPRRGGHH